MKKVTLLLSSILFVTLTAHAQSFSSGSTGADGALDLSSGDKVVQIPESGVFNYTTINIPASRLLTFKRNSRNMPVIILAQGSVQIAGAIDVSIPWLINNTDLAVPGPGGFYGGQSGMPGFGPGGGTLADCTARHAKWVGPLSLVPLVGGSGGAGRYCSDNSGSGGGGGGAILVASSSSITLSSGGAIRAKGFGYTGSGSGGAIRLVANSLNIGGTLDASSSFYSLGNYSATNPGVIRLEAPVGSLVFNGSANPPAVLSDINPALFATAAPLLTIISVGGFPVPSYSGSRFDTVDILLPKQLADPINVVVSANNISVGTQVQIGFVRGSTNGTSTPCSLAGTLASSQCTATISNLSRSDITYLLATATFDPPQSARSLNPGGANHVAKMRIETGIGSKPRFIFLRSNGTVIDQAKLSRKFLEQFGL